MCSNDIISNILGISDKNLVFRGDGISLITQKPVFLKRENNLGKGGVKI